MLRKIFTISAIVCVMITLLFLVLKRADIIDWDTGLCFLPVLAYLVFLMLVLFIGDGDDDDDGK